MREEQATLSTYAEKLVEAHASLTVAETEKNKVLSTFVADNIQKTGDLARQMDEPQQELVKAEKRLAATAIYSPSDGSIQASSITTFEQVVSAETEIMRIIPANLHLEIEVFFASQDVGFVKPGQPAVIKFETFPFTRYGVLTGKMKTVARDAIPNPGAQEMEEQAARQFRSVVPDGNVQRSFIPQCLLWIQRRKTSTESFFRYHPAWPSQSKSKPETAGSSIISGRRLRRWRLRQCRRAER